MLTKFMTSLDNKIDAKFASNTQEMNKFGKMVETHDAAIRNLEVQMEQLAKMVGQRVQGKLPSDTEVNPKHVMAVTLRSG